MRDTIGDANIVNAPGSPWQNAYRERLIGMIRRERLDHVIVIDERHRKRRLRNDTVHSHGWRTHPSQKESARCGRPTRRIPSGHLVEMPECSGLHHNYVRVAA